MAKVDPLFSLIKSLSKSEKRHFKLSMSGFQAVREKNYIRLFDAIGSQKVYNEKAIKKKFENIPYFKHLSYIKTYLQRQILKNLRVYYQGVSSDMRMNDYIAEIEILYHKELYTDCYELIKKAKQFAIQYEKQPYVMILINLEMQLAWNINDQEKVIQIRKNSVKEMREVILQSQETNDLRKIYFDTLFDMRTWGIARSKDETNRVDEILNHPLMKKKSDMMRAQLVRNAIRLHIAHRQGNFEEEYSGMKQRAQIWEQKPHMLNDNLNNYLQNSIQQVDVGIKIFKFKEAEEVLQKLKRICDDNSDKINFRRKFDFRLIEIEILCKKGEYVSALELVPDMIAFIETNLHELDPLRELAYYYCIFRTYFGKGDFDNAHSYLQKVINFPQQVMVNLQNQARIINLILQYERKEFIYLGHLLGSTYRFLLKNKRIYETENIIIEFIRAAFRFTSSKDILKGLAEMKKKVMMLQDEPFERNFMEQFPLIEWIDSKLQNRPLSEIIRERCEEEMVKEKKKPGKFITPG